MWDASEKKYSFFGCQGWRPSVRFEMLARSRGAATCSANLRRIACDIESLGGEHAGSLVVAVVLAGRIGGEPCEHDLGSRQAVHPYELARGNLRDSTFPATAAHPGPAYPGRQGTTH